MSSWFRSQYERVTGSAPVNPALDGPACTLCHRAYSPILFRWRVECPRCHERVCRPCFSASCTVALCCDISAAAPFTLGRHGVCESCFADADAEHVFAREHAALLLRGDVVSRVVSTSASALGLSPPQLQPIWLALEPATRRLAWRSMQLNANAPVDSGELALSELRAVAVGAVAAAGAGWRGHGLPPTPPLGSFIRLSGGAAPGTSAPLLTIACRDVAQATRWAAALSALPVLHRARHSTVLGSVAGDDCGGGSGARGSSGASGAAAVTAAAAASAAARATRASERATFRASLGQVGMAHTASIMASRSSSASSNNNAAAGNASAGGGAASAPGVPAPPLATAGRWLAGLLPRSNSSASGMTPMPVASSTSSTGGGTSALANGIARLTIVTSSWWTPPPPA